ncbi:site-specific integrase [Oceanobacter mangrovi]|uniref:site-specific integrase n=1 Tax=Oceanobacter mangrovi TaxID=2862510 RepID=UPI001C8EAC3A|nr:site-specific integrase [Oceanobacter mangrovi]
MNKQSDQQDALHQGRAAELDILAKEAAILDASESVNTRRAIEGAVNHFTLEYGGLLPCTGEQLKNYLVRYAGELSVATLEQRRVLLGRWHKENGFATNPNDSELVRQVMRGIRRKYGRKQKQARPAPLRLIHQVVNWLDQQALHNTESPPVFRQALRDKAMLLTSFWFGLRSSELIGLRVCDVTLHWDAEVPYMELYLAKSKTDREGLGQVKKLESLANLCPMEAIRTWLEAGFHGVARPTFLNSDAPLFAAVSRWGEISSQHIHPNSVNKMIKSLFQKAGVDATEYSSHSMRRGVANWIIDSGASVAELTEWIGWRDTRTAMRYLDGKSSLPSKIIERHLGAGRAPLLTTDKTADE